MKASFPKTISIALALLLAAQSPVLAQGLHDGTDEQWRQFGNTLRNLDQGMERTNRDQLILAAKALVACRELDIAATETDRACKEAVEFYTMNWGDDSVGGALVRLVIIKNLSASQEAASKPNPVLGLRGTPRDLRSVMQMRDDHDWYRRKLMTRISNRLSSLNREIAEK